MAKIETQEKTHHHHSTCGCILPGGNNRRRVQIFFPEPTLSQQALAEETDINVIIKRARAVGELPRNNVQAYYADVSNIPDYQSALNILNQGNEAFASLPSELRLKFQNDPGQLLTFLQNPENHAQAVEMGLLEAQLPKTPQTPGKSNPRPENNESKTDNQGPIDKKTPGA